MVWSLIALFSSFLIGSEATDRIAICFFGLTRSLHYTKQSIHSHIFDILMQHDIGYDVFLHTYNLNSISNWRSKEFNVSLNRNEWKLLYPSQYALDDNDEIEREIVNPLLPLLLQNGDPWKELPPHTSLRNLIKQFYSLKRVTELWRNRTDDYRLVLYTRPDVWFFNDLNMTDIQDALHKNSIALKSDRFVYVPSFHSWGGVNDRFAFGPPEVMGIYGSRYDQALNYSKSHPLHPEIFLKDLFHYSNITTRATDILFERVRSNGILWGIPQGEVIPDKAASRYKLVKNILGHWNAVPIDKKQIGSSEKPKSQDHFPRDRPPKKSTRSKNCFIENTNIPRSCHPTRDKTAVSKE